MRRSRSGGRWAGLGVESRSGEVRVGRRPVEGGRGWKGRKKKEKKEEGERGERKRKRKKVMDGVYLQQ